MKLYELAFACFCYAGFTNNDKQYNEFLKKISPNLDIKNKAHRDDLLKWLNDWSCRQFELDSHQDASNNLREWYEKDEQIIPSLGKTLLELSDNDICSIEIVYGDLKNVRSTNLKTVGATGASKILFALRKDIFPPWDGAIREEYSNNGNPKSYITFLRKVKNILIDLKTECGEKGFTLPELPSRLSRDTSSLIKLIDEYNWLVITKKCKPPKYDDLEKWYQWAKP